jgi:hypothetical protein
MIYNSPQGCDSKRIDAIRVYQPKLALYRSVRWYHFLFLVILGLQASYMLTTMGEPYRQFLIKADREGFQGEKRIER